MKLLFARSHDVCLAAPGDCSLCVRALLIDNKHLRKGTMHVKNDRVLGVHHEIQTQQDRIMEQSGNLRALAGICMYVSKTREL